MNQDTDGLLEREIGVEDVIHPGDPDFNGGNVALVTGAASGIGRAVAVALAANGLRVVAVDIDERGLEATALISRRMGATVEPFTADLQCLSDIDACVSRAAEVGRVRYLANVAGMQHVDSLEDFPVEMYDRMQSIMVRAAFYLTKVCIPQMRASSDGCGVIANMCSIHSHVATKNKVAYNIAKFGLRGLTQSIAAEGGGKIRAFSVSVGYVRTPLALSQMPAQARQLGIPLEQVISEVMMGRSRVKDMMRPVDVANLFIIGFSKYSKYLVGGDLLFDGGVVLTY